MANVRDLLRSAMMVPALLLAPNGGPASAQERPPAVQQAARLDVVFVIDATGSMGDEIQQVKEHLRATARSITSGNPRPDVRFGVVVYRDTEDSEHTRLYPLTRNVDQVHTVLGSLVADGGGDTPEDVDAGLDLAIHGMSWDPAAAHLLFLVGDAGPKNYGVDRQALLRDARRNEIRIHTIQASGMDAAGQSYFRSLATSTGGVAEVLTYRAEVVVDGRPRVVFERGGDTFVTRRELTPAESSLSFAELESRSLVARDTSGRAAAARTTRARRAGAGAPTASAPMADSDVGGIIAREARGAAAARGVAY